MQATQRISDRVNGICAGRPDLMEKLNVAREIFKDHRMHSFLDRFESEDNPVQAIELAFSVFKTKAPATKQSFHHFVGATVGAHL